MNSRLSRRTLASIALASAVALAPATARAEHSGQRTGEGFGHDGRVEDDRGRGETWHGHDDHSSGMAQLASPIAEGLAGPLQMSVRGHSVYVAQDFAGILTRIDHGSATDIATNPGGEIAGSTSAAAPSTTPRPASTPPRTRQQRQR
jgi:hypothetical protein